ncbi:MFS transporter [uncultured Nitratireductor sp.]|uniref:MFS transporter n=1 Tax=uncultured Nitratireductor sp. TaxID=520953 RepID=UPI0025DB0E55|nr:MFS transporter [uncultured Nitratireductor sp.]
MSIAIKKSINAWPAVASIAMGTFVMVTTELMPIGLLSQIARDFAVSNGTAGLLISLPGLVAAVVAPLATLAAGRLDRRLLLIVLSLFLFASSMASAVASSFAMLLIARLVLGVCIGGFWTFSTPVGRQLVQAHAGARATAIIMGGISAGTILGVPAGTLIADVLNWRAAFGSVAALAAAACIFQILSIPSVTAGRAITLSTLLGLMTIPRARAGLIAVGLIASGQFMAYTYLEVLITGPMGFAGAALSVVLLGYGVAGLIGNFAGERFVSWNSRGTFIATAVSLCLTIAFAALVQSAVAVSFAIVLLWGFAFGLMPICVQVWLYEAAPDRFEGGSALLVTILQIAVAFGAWAGGRLIDASGVATTFQIAAGFCLVGGVVIALLGRKPN